MDMLKYKVARQGQVIGEYEAASIQLLVNAGNLMVTDHAWSAGMEGWKRLSELGYALPVATPPPLARATPAAFIPPASSESPPPLPAPLSTEDWRSMPDGQVPAACPKCASPDIRSFGILFQQGAHTSTSVGMTLSGQVGGMVTSGHTHLAAATQPPQRGSDGAAMLILLGCGLGIGIFGFLAFNYSSVGAVLGAALGVAIVAGGIYLGMMSSGSVDLEHAKQLYRWKNSWCCMKCGNRFMSLYHRAFRG
jgi:hypothetical protein